MDDGLEMFYILHFKTAYLEKKGVEFENWFSDLAGHALGTDFEPVGAHGNQGDWKCDGRQRSTDTIFQCYAPDTFSTRKAISKIKEDFDGAKEKWGSRMKVWAFVHNKGSVPVTIIDYIDTLSDSNPDIKIEIWSKPKLFELFEMMTPAAKYLMFGAVPNQATVNDLALKDLEPVIDALKKREPDPKALLPPPPSARKLEKNALSKDSEEFLRLGRRKVQLVENFFTKAGAAELGEKIAESFRKRYAELKALELDADDIFTYLHKFTGVYPDAKGQCAAMAVMAYFFDSCDIFEDPTEEDATT